MNIAESGHCQTFGVLFSHVAMPPLKMLQKNTPPLKQIEHELKPGQWQNIVNTTYKPIIYK